MRRLAFALLAATTIAAPAVAQTTTATTTKTETYVSSKPTDVLSSNAVGLDITNGAQQTVGTIKDLLISNGTLAGYVVSVGGFLGIGQHYVVISPPAIKLVYSMDDKKWYAHMEADKEALKAAPEFKYEGQWKQ